MKESLIRQLLPRSPDEGPPLPRGLGQKWPWKRDSSLPNKEEMIELDRLLEKAHGVLIRWRLKMTPSERVEFPSTFGSVNEAEKALMKVGDQLQVISSEIGLGWLRD